MQEQDAKNFSIQNQEPPQKRRFLVFAISFAAAIFFFILFTLGRAPAEFLPDTFVEIEAGSSLSEIADLFEEKKIIRSPKLFVFFVRLEGRERAIESGTYLFTRPQNVFAVARRVATGNHGIEKVRVTIPEGTSTKEMAVLIGRSLPGVTFESFTKEGSAKEGYLFPDTYFFFSTATTGPVIDTLEKNFSDKTKRLREEARAMGMDWHEVITMASLVEEEAATEDDRRVISGILWKRIAKGMRLQVDAPFVYLIGKGSAELSQDDLAIDSPYNTYRYPGLPAGPISNPGLDSIEAAIYPQETPFFYYLSDKEGVIHYANTFEDHKLNKERYLR